MASPYLQHNGTFQLMYSIEEFADFQVVHKQIFLNGLFKLRLKGYVLSAQAESVERNYPVLPATIPDIFDPLDSYNFNPVLQLRSPQIVNQITETDGFLIPLNTNGVVNVLPVAVDTETVTTNVKWVISHKPMCVIGDPLAHYISVNLNSNIISFQAFVSDDDNPNFNRNITSFLGSGTIILTFEYESLKAV